MRELPFKVWKARRTLVISPRSSGADTSEASACSALPITSRASSRKISRISSSSSSPVVPAGVGAADNTGAGRVGGKASSAAASDEVWTKSAMACANSSRTA